MKQPRHRNESASALLFALGTIAVLSIVAGGVLMNATTRYNSMSTQVGGWKDALHAAEAGGDLAFNEVRKYGLNSATGFSSAVWSAPAPAPLPATDSWSAGIDSTKPAISFGTNNALSAQITVDRFGSLPGNDAIGYYRIRSIGTAQLNGLKRTGMDNRMDKTTKGDNLLRRIDFNIDHFISTYGYGDALPLATATTANGKGTTYVKNAGRPQVSRRIELIAIPVMPIEGAVKTSGAFNGTLVDSYDSANGAYPNSSNPTGASPYTGKNYLVDAHDGDVVTGSSTFSAGHIYGDVSTNGGAASSTSNNITGVVDNNVPIVIKPAVPGVDNIPAMPPSSTPDKESGTPSSSLTPPTRRAANGTLQTEFWYEVTSISGMTIHPLTSSNGTPIDTTVNIYVTRDGVNITGVDGVNVDEGVTANIYFRGDVGGKARDYDNLNSDGPVMPWTWFYTNATERTTATGFTSSDIGKIAYQDGNPGTYWKLTATTPSWSSYSVPTTYKPVADVVSAFVPTTIPRVNSSNALTSYASAAERNGTATPAVALKSLVAQDVGKIAYQADNSTYWRLVSISPLTWTPAQPYKASPLVSRAGHMWFYGLSPSDGSARKIDIGPPGTMYAGFYAPGHDFSTNGNPDIYGVMVAKSFTMNGNNTFHFDKQLLAASKPNDYRVASYIEDVR